MRKTHSQTRFSTQQRGVTLVELLITVVILSVGLLGTAALHLVSLRNNVDAHMRSQASALAADIADRMRTNRNVARGGGYTAAVGSSPSGGTQAVADVTQWRASIALLLPNGNGSIATNGNVVTITVSWLERLTTATSGGATTSTVSFQTSTEI